MKTLFYTGRNRENLSGVSWKVWKNQRKRRKVETRWGPVKVVRRRISAVGALQRKQWKFRSEVAATQFYEAKIREKERKGYEVSTRRSWRKRDKRNWATC